MKRGIKPRRKKPPKWSKDLAYAVGLIATDGNLSKDGYHLELTSKDIEQLENFREILGLSVKIGHKNSTYSKGKVFRVQFGDIVLYRFLNRIGVGPAKTKTIGSIKIPKKYYFDFLRGHHDGDGSFYSYWDPRWKSSFMYYLTFVSASLEHIKWLQDQNRTLLGVSGVLSKVKNSYYQLRYAKEESLKIIRKMYHSKSMVCLSRKRLKIEEALSIVDEKI